MILSELMQSGGTFLPGAPLYENWRESLKTVPPGIGGIHPFGNLFPMIPEPDLRETLRSSLADGQNHPVVLHKGMLLDGRNRARELIELGKPIIYILFTGTDRQALEFVAAENFARRHLDDKQRQMIAARMANMRAGDNQFSRKVPPIGGTAPSLFNEPEQAVATEEDAKPLMSIPEAAKVVHTSHRGTERAAVLIEKGTPELQAAVEYGPVSMAAGEALARLPEAEQKAVLDALPRDAAGKLTPQARKALAPVIKEMRVEDQAEKKRKRDEREQKLGARIRALPDIKAGLILSDFEWHFKVRSEETGMDRHAANHYVTAKEASTPEAIVDRQRERMSIAADDCIHLMWCPASFNAVALKVMDLQGFTYVSQFCWIKPSIGTGFWVRDKHELLLIGVKGKIPCPAMGDQFDSAIEAPKGEHSEKPDFQYEIAEHYFPSLPKVELNARRAREGWISWGNEAPEVEQPELAIDGEEEAA